MDLGRIQLRLVWAEFEYLMFNLNLFELKHSFAKGLLTRWILLSTKWTISQEDEQYYQKDKQVELLSYNCNSNLMHSNWT